MIDAEILDNLNYFRNKYYTDGGSTENGIIADNLNMILPFLQKDVVAVVRCKDCKNGFNVHGVLYCKMPLSAIRPVRPDHFCSCGERKENEKA